MNKEIVIKHPLNTIPMLFMVNIKSFFYEINQFYVLILKPKLYFIERKREWEKKREGDRERKRKKESEKERERNRERQTEKESER